MSRHAPLDELVGQPLPDLAIPAPDGRPYALRGRVGAGPLALFMFIQNGTPG
jgi:hypothetical protein